MPTIDTTNVMNDLPSGGAPSKVPKSPGATIEIKATSHGTLPPLQETANPIPTTDDPSITVMSGVDTVKRSSETPIHPMGLGAMSATISDGVGEKCS